MNKYILYAAFALTLVATVGSLFTSEVLHWAPCVLCWYQRIMLYPLVIILAVAIVKEISNLEYIVLPMTGIGMLVALYHNLLQYHIIPESLAPCSVSTSCITLYHFWFDFLTLPLLSLITFVVITILMIVYRKNNHE